MTKQDKNLLSNILHEARAYNTFEDIEKLVELGSDLAMIPMQPLYISLLTTSSDQVATILPKLSLEQRQALIDLDFWKKDIVDVNSFEYWIEVYSKCRDEAIIQQFVQTEDFLLYLKSRVNIYTFDQEDPEYPDHDHYFLTEDMLLLVEYSDEYNYAAEIKYLIQNLYIVVGVENAYTTLFKLVNDSFSILQENSYYAKKERLRDYGFVDYFEAMEKLHPFARMGQLNNFIKQKAPFTGSINIIAQNQSLHSSALVSFDSEMENILSELSKVKDDKRQQFLHFTFIRLINSTITLTDSLRGGRVELTKIGNQTKARLELAIQFIHSVREFDKEVLFDLFDFFDVYKIGKTLVETSQAQIKKALKDTPFDSDEFEYFLGTWWSTFLDNSFLDVPKTKTFGAGLHARAIDSLPAFDFWKKEIEMFKSLLPFITQFYKTIFDLKKEGKLNDSFYLNYEVDNMDFEAILISSFINYCLGHFGHHDVNKMGLSIQEFKIFIRDYFFKKNEEYHLLALEHEKMTSAISGFEQLFGFSIVVNFKDYLHGILAEHLTGYEFDSLDDEDYKHIGGPILLANNTSN